jgi:hypothetical protein
MLFLGQKPLFIDNICLINFNPRGVLSYDIKATFSTEVVLSTVAVNSMMTVFVAEQGRR